VPYFKPGKELKELINDDNAATQASQTSSSRGLTDDNRQPPII
jgi:hypothetical protein